MRHTAETKAKAVALYAVTGSAEETANRLKLPPTTVRTWTREDWWQEKMAKVRQEKDAEIDAKMSEIIALATNEIKDRVTKGDQRLMSNGKNKRVKMSGRDLAIVAGTLYDKRQLIRNLPTAIRSDNTQEALRAAIGEFEQLARESRAKTIEGEVVSVQREKQAFSANQNG